MNHRRTLKKDANSGPFRVIESAVSFNQIPQPEISQRSPDINETGRLALRAAFIGFFVDMFDVYLPIVALGPAMSYFQPVTLSPALKSTLFYIVFALSLVGRPAGAILFGHYGDKLGRRRVTIISMGGFALVTPADRSAPRLRDLGNCQHRCPHIFTFGGWGISRRRVYSRQSIGHGVRTQGKARKVGRIHSHRISAFVGSDFAAHDGAAERTPRRIAPLAVCAVGMAHSFLSWSTFCRWSLPLLHEKHS